mgnify:CR=1 FL=1
MGDTILAQSHGNWVEITLNRPERLNSFNDEMHLALRAQIESARDSGARAILLTGAGHGFCAGQDLGDRDPAKMDGPPDLSETLENFYNPLVRLIRSLEFPVVCAVNGVAAGAGANLALACDIVLAADSAKFIQSFAKVGLVPDGGGVRSSGSSGSAASILAKAQRVGHVQGATALAFDPQTALARFATFDSVLALIRRHREVPLLIEVEKGVRLVRYAPGRIEFEPSPSAAPDLALRLAQALQNWTGVRWGVTVVNEGGAPTIVETRQAAENQLKAEAMEHPLVAAVFANFPNAKITEIRSKAALQQEAAEEALAEVEDEWDPFEDD